MDIQCFFFFFSLGLSYWNVVTFEQMRKVAKEVRSELSESGNRRWGIYILIKAEYNYCSSSSDQKAFYQMNLNDSPAIL